MLLPFTKAPWDLWISLGATWLSLFMITVVRILYLEFNIVMGL